MLSIFSDRPSRRAMLQIGSLGAMNLAQKLTVAGTALADADATSVLTGKSVIFLFLHGGPSQIETFDPKMTAPAEIRSVTGELATAVPGITFGGTFPGLAQRLDRFSVVRKVSSAG